MNKWILRALGIVPIETAKSSDAHQHMEHEIKVLKQKILEDVKDNAELLESLHEFALKEIIRK